MSFKEDFFEALRSVKRDFFRESDNSGYTGESSHEIIEESTHSASDLLESGDFVMPGDIITDDGTASGRDAPDAMDAFHKASALNSGAMDIDDMDDDNLENGLHKMRGDASSDGPELFRSLDSDSGADFLPGDYPDITGMPATNDSRKIYDFDADDLYSDDKTIISRNTVIRGALQTDDSVRLLGQILGDIECKSNIVVAGKVRGNTSAANAYIIDAQIDGNMLCDDTINVNKDAWVLGNIRAQQAEIDGKIKGNIEIRHAVSIGSASSVIGNISTDELEIKRGAFVNGQIIMYSPSRDVLDRFEDFDRQ